MTLDPTRLNGNRLNLNDITTALRRSNSEVGGRLIELSGREFMVRGRGYIKNVQDIERVVVKTNNLGTRCASVTSVVSPSGQICGAASRSWMAVAKWSVASWSCAMAKMRST